jgi:hypothetical protein
MWLYHVPFTICVVSVLKIAFCDKKKEPYYFFSSISLKIRFLAKKGRQVCINPNPLLTADVKVFL